MNEVVSEAEELQFLIMKGLLTVELPVSPSVLDGEHARVEIDGCSGGSGTSASWLASAAASMIHC